MTEASDHHTKRRRTRSRPTSQRSDPGQRPDPPTSAEGARRAERGATGPSAPERGAKEHAKDARSQRPGASGNARAPSQDWAAIGTIVGAFGIHGELKVQPLTDFPERFEHTPTVYLGRDHAPYRVASARLHGRLVIVSLDGIDSAVTAERLRGQELAIPAAELIALPQDSYYLHDLIGLRVAHVDGADLGVVADVITGAGNDLFVVRRPEGPDVLVPAVKEFIKAVDLPGGVVRVEPIPGLFDDRAVVADEGAARSAPDTAGPAEAEE